MVKNIFIGIFVVLTVTFGTLFYLETTKEPKVKVVTKEVVKEVEKEVTPTEEEKELVGFYYGTYDMGQAENAEGEGSNSDYIEFYDNNKYVYFTSRNGIVVAYTGDYSISEKTLTLKVDWLLTEQFGEKMPDFTFTINDDKTLLSDSDKNMLLRKTEISSEVNLPNLFQNIVPNQDK